MLSARLGVGHNRCPHCGGVERRSKNNEKPVFPILLYHISIDFSSAERPHFSTVCGFCRKKFEKKFKKGVDSLPDGML
nr:MAG TPA: zinc-ribbon domain protein [Caudoviricetes sp.]